jgi:DNA segregation ATPase FtsK/SpoIIIE-like protein
MYACRVSTCIEPTLGTKHGQESEEEDKENCQKEKEVTARRKSHGTRITTQPTKHPRSKRGSHAGRIIMSTLRRLPHHGSIKSKRWFAEPTRKQIQRGVHTALRRLEADIRTFIDLHNKSPKPFKWTKSADQILASVKRFCYKAQQTSCGEL